MNTSVIRSLIEYLSIIGFFYKLFFKYLLVLFYPRDLDVTLSNDDLKMDCITAKCTGNETFFKAEDCGLRKAASCRECI